MSVGEPLKLVFDAPRRGKPPKHWADLAVAERRPALSEAGLPAFRADQLSRHWFERLETDPTTWTDLPAAQREAVAEAYFPTLLNPLKRQACDDGTTLKTLWRLHDGSLVESVLMRYARGVRSADDLADDDTRGMRSTICISSQAGCGMACPFCATGQGGLQRNLSTAEIVSQVADGARMLRNGEVPGGVGRINNVVFMGMGEPLANYKAVIGAVRSLTTPEPHGLGISARGVTVSTVGLVPRIRQLATEGMPVTLALSLHAPDDELRDELVPVNNRWPVDEVVDAAYFYARETGRRVSIEYALIRDINDQAHRADLLAKVLRQRGKGWVHVNLIPLNPTPGSKWTASRRSDEKEFVRRLEAGGVPVTVRDTRGQEIDGACGQLAATER
ncbi:dual-specificity RNA methyltransferase RlmN [Enemella evansiae]|uniref:23S rRNA (adenine(2503)-C(2))-methyltransferase RlmN n=1 Tax=Enemella evansiae TaxID=2016499 RepID=UPI000B96A4A6|nr:23S rRNA (adenine(2503)-C(2))-methyltransferase RlmN [Enemella evansiae]PFG67733.1 23S rRNA m(2)A-2503 methyltransferase (EC 211192) [Propionibacteriaceae bacterium ES.041]OYN92920.1 23S rRNA (adenine(2503)-C(2))-methyltransferase RlmN [Enemella evansiae]OYN94660.1 23S rRNA (adenine(2503)-C(2))-methyltransferase RlmN [Enemella evansiae]OYO04244.1 23S rRNA (adenine(2503)-C(2))-methyltransferase RlmN [Enemella evansiae]OYO07068.1 23S rRNA (adenine(2503)-C(2))-methyltransferase RlmN [Enemella 